MKHLFTVSLLLMSGWVFGQNYTSYFTGNTNDTVTSALGGVCLMGGATEDDNAMKWFLEKANGGDILVLRASGSDGYNNYFYSQLGISVNSVETIVFNNATASNSTYIHQKINQAEAIWFAGGDQWDYVSYWRNTPIETLINDAVQNRNIVIGGTSAGMAILGGFYFSAQNGTVTSAAALANPYNTNITVDSAHFLENNYLQHVVTDTHYDDPDRKGRHVTFLARILTDYGVAAQGIACDEYTAVCIDTNGIASVYGGYPTWEEEAFFIQTNCELPDISPEECTSNLPLDWNRTGQALKVYKVYGTPTGANTFDLNDWKTGVGGDWQHWYVDQGTLFQTSGTEINCPVGMEEAETLSNLGIYPNPFSDKFTLELPSSEASHIKIFSLSGQLLFETTSIHQLNIPLDMSHFEKGHYLLQVTSTNYTANLKLVKN